VAKSENVRHHAGHVVISRYQRNEFFESRSLFFSSRRYPFQGNDSCFATSCTTWVWPLV